MTGIPNWAGAIISAVARQHRRRPPEVTWQSTRKHHGTSGSAKGDKIFMRTGRSRLKAKLTLLHELAHWVTDEGHTPTFWLKAWELYRRFRVPIGYALRNESHYRQGALTAYWAGRDRRGRRPVLRVQIQTTVDAGPPAG